MSVFPSDTKNPVHRKMNVQINVSDKPPCQWHWTRRSSTSQSLTIYHRSEEWSETRDMKTKATNDMKILSAKRRTGGAALQQILSLFAGMKKLFSLQKMEFMLQTVLLVFPVHAGRAVNADFIYCTHYFVCDWETEHCVCVFVSSMNCHISVTYGASFLFWRVLGEDVHLLC